VAAGVVGVVAAAAHPDHAAAASPWLAAHVLVSTAHRHACTWRLHQEEFFDLLHKHREPLSFCCLPLMKPSSNLLWWRRYLMRNYWQAMEVLTGGGQFEGGGSAGLGAGGDDDETAGLVRFQAPHNIDVNVLNTCLGPCGQVGPNLSDILTCFVPAPLPASLL